MKAIVIDDCLLAASQMDPSKPVTLSIDLDYIEDEGYAD